MLYAPLRRIIGLEEGSSAFSILHAKGLLDTGLRGNSEYFTASRDIWGRTLVIWSRIVRRGPSQATISRRPAPGVGTTGETSRIGDKMSRGGESSGPTVGILIMANGRSGMVGSERNDVEAVHTQPIVKANGPSLLCDCRAWPVLDRDTGQWDSLSPASGHHHAACQRLTPPAPCLALFVLTA